MTPVRLVEDRAAVSLLAQTKIHLVLSELDKVSQKKEGTLQKSLMIGNTVTRDTLTKGTFSLDSS